MRRQKSSPRAREISAKERKKRKVDFSWVCKLRYVNGWCLGGGSRLGNGGARWFVVVYGGLRWWKKGCKMKRREQRKGNCKEI